MGWTWNLVSIYITDSWKKCEQSFKKKPRNLQTHFLELTLTCKLEAACVLYENYQFKNNRNAIKYI